MLADLRANTHFSVHVFGSSLLSSVVSLLQITSLYVRATSCVTYVMTVSMLVSKGMVSGSLQFLP